MRKLPYLLSAIMLGANILVLGHISGAASTAGSAIGGTARTQIDDSHPMTDLIEHFQLDKTFKIPGYSVNLKRTLPHFNRFAKLYSTSIGNGNEESALAITVDSPDASYEAKTDIDRWLVAIMDSTITSYADPFCEPPLYKYDPSMFRVLPFVGYPSDFKSASVYFNSKFLADMRSNYAEYSPIALGHILDFRAVDANDRYITYHVLLMSDLGGYANYIEDFVTYDLKNRRPLRNGSLFRTGTQDKVWDVIFDTMRTDPKFIDCMPDAEREISFIRERTKPGSDFPKAQPNAAIVPGGVIFSFQSGDIGCMADGTFHFFIPYEKIADLLSDNGKSLFKK